MKGIKTNKMVLRVLVACTAAQVEQIDLFFYSECYLQRYKINNIPPATLSLSSPQVWLVT